VKVFISYSSKDSEFVTRLAIDLKKMGFETWLDKWEIKVGDDIFDKIQFGIRDSDYVVLVLSCNSVSSGWVDKEWKTVYWSEIASHNVRLLPALLNDCEIPEFLKFRKYADFRKGYDTAFEELLSPIKKTNSLSIEKRESHDALTGRLRLELFKKIFDFAYSSGGLDMTKEGAKDFALRWHEQWNEEKFELFKEVVAFAYSGSGLNMNHEGAKGFALQWLEKHYDRDFSFFKEVVAFAYSPNGLNMNHEGAKGFALQWLEKHEPHTMPQRPS
jgi:hypothetical protein